MHRCYVDMPLETGKSYTLSAEESAHVSRVLRMRAGDRVELLDGASLFEGEITSVSQASVTVLAHAQRPSPESCARLTLYQGLPKLDKLELIVQKATELGAYRIVPVVMERSIAKAIEKQSKADRYARIALEAAKQAGRAHVPTVDPPLPLSKALAAMESHALVLVAWEDAKGLRIKDAIEQYLSKHGQTPTDVGLVIGPEGGISKEEMSLLESIGALPVTLRSRILRTETAGLCALALALGALGEM